MAEVRGWLEGHVSDLEALAHVAEERLGFFSNEVLRIRLDWRAGPEGAPASLIVKRRIPGRNAPESEAFAKEARILNEIAAPAPVAAPRALAVSAEVLVMEDLEALGHFDFLGGATDAHAADALEALGRFHAHGRDAAQPSWLPSFADPQHAAALGAQFDRSWREHRDAIADVVPPDFPALADAWTGRLERLLASLDGCTTLLHGDAHGENLPTRREGGVAFLDWAAAHAGPPAFDLAVFLGMSFPPERRRAHEPAWVAAHAAAWARAGGPAFAEPWPCYARGLLMRAFQLISQVRDPQLLRNPGFALVVGRCAQAALDHTAAAALD